MLNQQIPTRYPAPHPEAKFVRLTVFTGPMFSGKSSALIKQANRFRHSHGIMLAFRPLQDTRDPQDSLVSHDGAQYPATRVATAWEILDLALRARERQLEARDEGLFGVCIDEVNLYPDKERVLDVALQLRAQGIFVFCAGLTTDYKGDPFEPIPELLAHADSVHKFMARCEGCQQDERDRTYWSAMYTVRSSRSVVQEVIEDDRNGPLDGPAPDGAAELVSDGKTKAQIVVGGRDIYTPLCVHCLLTLGEFAADHRVLRSYANTPPPSARSIEADPAIEPVSAFVVEPEPPVG